MQFCSQYGGVQGVGLLLIDIIISLLLRNKDFFPLKLISIALDVLDTTSFCFTDDKEICERDGAKIDFLIKLYKEKKRVFPLENRGLE